MSEDLVPQPVLRNQVQVGVEVIHSPSHSSPGQEFYIYFIRIVNVGSNRVQLLRRHWDIRSGDGRSHEVDGDGVIGLQPMLEPNEEYNYHSGVPISRAPGVMGGFYTFRALDVSGSPELFQVPIEDFELFVPEGQVLDTDSGAQLVPRVLN
jgi:ApaG protein